MPLAGGARWKICAVYKFDISSLELPHRFIIFIQVIKVDECCARLHIAKVRRAEALRRMSMWMNARERAHTKQSAERRSCIYTAVVTVWLKTNHVNKLEIISRFVILGWNDRPFIYLQLTTYSPRTPKERINRRCRPNRIGTALLVGDTNTTIEVGQNTCVFFLLRLNATCQLVYLTSVARQRFRIEIS